MATEIVGGACLVARRREKKGDAAGEGKIVGPRENTPHALPHHLLLPVLTKMEEEEEVAAMGKEKRPKARTLPRVHTLQDLRQGDLQQTEASLWESEAGSIA